VRTELTISCRALEHTSEDLSGQIRIIMSDVMSACPGRI
jgi:hypothetical protein